MKPISSISHTKQSTTATANVPPHRSDRVEARAMLRDDHWAWHVAKCPHCARPHDIGAGSGEQPAFAGLRAVDCGKLVFVVGAP